MEFMVERASAVMSSVRMWCRDRARESRALDFMSYQKEGGGKGSVTLWRSRGKSICLPALTREAKRGSITE